MKKNSILCLLGAIMFCVTALCSAAPLHDAIKKGDVQQVQQLLKQGADVSVLDDQEKDMDILNFAIEHLSQDKAQMEHLRAIISLLIDAGADVNASSYIHQMGMLSPLHSLIGFGDIELVKLLIRKGADVNLQPVKGNFRLETSKTPLHMAVFFIVMYLSYLKLELDEEKRKELETRKEHILEIMKLLIAHGAKKDIKIIVDGFDGAPKQFMTPKEMLVRLVRLSKKENLMSSEELKRFVEVLE